eukprot:SAG31_NODE_1118_length_9816_cov_41.561593_6_plen_78_part_00
METVLHAVDIGHPALSWVLESRWARLVATEFQAQVDRERVRSSTSNTRKRLFVISLQSVRAGGQSSCDGVYDLHLRN